MRGVYNAKVFMECHPPVLSTVSSGTYCLANIAEALLDEWGLKMFLSIPETLNVFFMHLESISIDTGLKGFVKRPCDS